MNNISTTIALLFVFIIAIPIFLDKEKNRGLMAALGLITLSFSCYGAVSFAEWIVKYFLGLN